MKHDFITIERILRTGVTNFVRNLSLGAAAIAIMTVTLTIILFSLVASAAFNHSITQLTDKLDVSVYLNDSVTPTQLTEFLVQLRAQPNVKNATYYSKTQDLAQAEAQNAGNKALLEGISETGNVIPAKVQIEPVDPNKIQQIKNFLDKPSSEVLEDSQTPTSYSGDEKTAINEIAHATYIIREAGVVAVIVFALISMLIIFNTIRMAIFNRRDEISIMRLLGANPWFIRGPFVVESVLYGIISALVSVFIIDLLFAGSANALQASSLGLLDIGYANYFFKSRFWLLLLLQLVLGILIGAVSSVVATRRYLKLKSLK
jgi:cell division transport system permease protein